MREAAQSAAPTSWPDKVFIGIPVLLVGLLMNYALFRFMPNPTESIEALFSFVFLSAYGVVANLFILVGLKKLFGARPVFDRIIGQNLRRLIWIAIGLTIITVIAALLATVTK